MRAKVADFGLASRIYMRTNQQFGANQNKFPFRWSAYEILENGVAIKEKSDIWSFGILMWEIYYLGTALPYADIEVLPELVTFLRDNQRLEKPPSCPEFLYELMLSCWHGNYLFRPTFTELKRELKQFRKNERRRSEVQKEQQSDQETPAFENETYGAEDS